MDNTDTFSDFQTDFESHSVIQLVFKVFPGENESELLKEYSNDIFDIKTTNPDSKEMKKGS